MTKKLWTKPSARGTVLDRPVRTVAETRKGFTGRGLDWAKKPINQRCAKRVARYYAGRILTQAVQDGWAPDDLVARYGKDGLATIHEALLNLGWWLESSGDAKGRPVPNQGRPKRS